MRILRGYELPGHYWKGYRLVGDTLWSPEGKAFRASDQRWWSLTVAMAREFRAMVAARQGDVYQRELGASLVVSPDRLVLSTDRRAIRFDCSLEGVLADPLPPPEGMINLPADPLPPCEGMIRFRSDLAGGTPLSNHGVIEVSSESITRQAPGVIA